MSPADRSSRLLAGLFLAMTMVFVAAIILPSIGSSKGQEEVDSALDINIHDTYFVVANVHLFGAMAVLALLSSLFYLIYTRMTGLRLSQVLGWAHFIGSGLIALSLIPMISGFMVTSNAPRRYYSYSDAPMFEGVINLTTLWFVLGVLAQSCFVINVAFSPFRKRTA